ncbi:universal stress protein [Rubrolithibacter danxiaensis]|uniref:universal stress protein n=1 Tax=Rubrolithibacter danxiaensis TaxID=3390805 RepID=UPI003BF8A7D6
METVLIPTDFSDSSFNAAKYAAELSREIKIGRIVLLKSYHISVYEQLLCTADFVQLSQDEIDEEIEDQRNKLKMLASELQRIADTDTVIEIRVSELQLIRSIYETVHQERADLILIGSDDKVKTGQESYIGSNVINIAKSSPIPVLIIPPAYRFEAVKKAVIACDLKKTSQYLSEERLLRIFKNIPADFLVLNVDPTGKHLHPDEKLQHELNLLNQKLKDFRYQTYFSENKDIIKGILDFTTEQQAQLIIALPKEHSFFNSLTHKSITAGLSMASQKPVLILK